MTYFQNIHSLADLKKEYRRLALQHHPDKGGDTAIMQRVNTEFGRLFDIWKDKPDISATSTGYEYDHSGATAKEYTEYVYNEYRWKGRNYKGQHAPEIVEPVRAWLKETYPGYRFSVRRENYHSIHIRLMKADFEAFTKESGKVQGDVNHYNISSDKTLTDRAKEVMQHPEGPAHKALRQALGKARFDFIASLRFSGKLILGEDAYGSTGEHYFWPKQYSSARNAQKRMDKLLEAGIRCRLTGYNGGYIEFLGYTSETENLLEQEREEYTRAYRVWVSEQSISQKMKAIKYMNHSDQIQLQQP